VFENLQDMNVDEPVEEFGVTREQTSPRCSGFFRARRRGSTAPPLMLVLFDNGTRRTFARCPWSNGYRRQVRSQLPLARLPALSDVL